MEESRITADEFLDMVRAALVERKIRDKSLAAGRLEGSRKALKAIIRERFGDQPEFDTVVDHLLATMGLESAVHGVLAAQSYADLIRPVEAAS